MQNLIARGFWACLCLLLTACSPLTSIDHPPSTYTPDYGNFHSPIAKPYDEELARGKDGALIIADGASALLHRLALVQMAQTSIDIQTYIYKNELTSRLLLYELYRAADRGVKIRILIDDNGVSSDFYSIMLLHSHKNIEVRIFNPYLARFGGFRIFEALFDFDRINKRMHNKLFIFDNTALIVGGRNIGDEYFDNGYVNFTDTDLLFIGNVAKDAKLNFEQFWSYHRSIPANLFVSESKQKSYDKKTKSPKMVEKYKISDEQWEEYLKDIEGFRRKYHNKDFKMAWGEGIFLADLPTKVDTTDSTIKTPILDSLTYYLNQARESIIISSSYLIPGKAAMHLWRDFVRRGVEVQILTNSLASVDVVSVYSHWENYRDKLALMGLKIYEYPNFETDKARLSSKATFYKNRHRGLVSLHSKSMIIDENLVAVGSFNLDYRSAMLNTESIVFFKSPELARELKQLTKEQLAKSYKIACDTKRKCHWELGEGADSKIFKHPPNTSIWLRFYKTLSKIMPEKLM